MEFNFDLTGYYNTADIASIIGIKQANFSMGAKLQKNDGIFLKIGSILFVRFNPVDFKSRIVFTATIDNLIVENLDKLTDWKNKYPLTAFMDNVGLTLSQTKKIESKGYFKIIKEDKKTILVFNDKIKQILDKYTLYVISSLEFENLDKSLYISYEKIDNKTFLIWY